MSNYLEKDNIISLAQAVVRGNTEASVSLAQIIAPIILEESQTTVTDKELPTFKRGGVFKKYNSWK